MGAYPVEVIRPSIVQAFLDAFAETPGAQKTARTALQAVSKWATVRDLLPQGITHGVEVIRSDGGHLPWPEDLIKVALDYAKPPFDKIIPLALGSGQRGSDVVDMRWSDLDDDNGQPIIRVVQQKTKRELWVPLMFEMKDRMRQWERKPGFIIRKASGEPYTRPQISWAWWHERQTNDHLKGFDDYTLHGLRSTACVRLRRKGLTALQIANMIGMSEPMVARYTRLADQREMALSAARQTEAGTSKVHRLQKQRNSNG